MRWSTAKFGCCRVYDEIKPLSSIPQEYPIIVFSTGLPWPRSGSLKSCSVECHFLIGLIFRIFLGYWVSYGYISLWLALNPGLMFMFVYFGVEMNDEYKNFRAAVSVVHFLLLKYTYRKCLFFCSDSSVCHSNCLTTNTKDHERDVFQLRRILLLSENRCCVTHNHPSIVWQSKTNTQFKVEN